MGHIVRCLSLAQVLRDQHSCRVTFYMNRDPVGIAHVRAQGWPVQRVAADELGGDVVTDVPADILIVDLAGGVPAEDVRAVRRKNPNTVIVLMDGTCTGRLEADLVVCPLERLPDPAAWRGFKGQRYEGPAYALLDPAFAQVPRRTTTAAPSMSILVTMGGSDPHGLTLQALRALDAMPEEFATVVALGPAFLHDAELQPWFTGARRRYEIRRENSLLDLMSSSDLALVSFGTTVYELAAAGLPAIALAISEDHAQAAEIFARGGSLISLGLHSRIAEEEIQVAVRSLLSDPTKRQEMARCGQALVDGRGTERVAKILVSRMLERRSCPEDKIGSA
jgi:spore coat polysaccharide biosynthesis predicted glycosyltransferase SpsG